MPILIWFIIAAVVLAVAYLLGRSRAPAKIVFYINGKRMVPMNLSVDQQVVIGPVVIEDDKGNALTGVGLDNTPAPQWSLTNPAAGTLTPSADGLSATLVPANVPGQSTQVQLAASVGGVAMSAGTDVISIVPGVAEQLALSIGTPTAQAAPAAAPMLKK